MTKKRRKQFLALVLCVVIGLSTIPVPVFAKDSGDCDHEHDRSICSYIEGEGCNHVCDSNCGGTPSAVITISAFDYLPENIKTQNYISSDVNDLADLHLPDTLGATDDQTAAITISDVAWVCTSPEAGFTAAVPGVYEFTASLQTGYTLADGAHLPVITVVLDSGNMIPAKQTKNVSNDKRVSNITELKDAVAAFNVGADDMTILLTADIVLVHQLNIYNDKECTLTIQSDSSQAIRTLKRAVDSDGYQMISMGNSARLILEDIVIDGDNIERVHEAIYIGSDNSLTMDNNAKVINNNSNIPGLITGGLYIFGGQLTMLEGSLIENNQSYCGSVTMIAGGSIEMLGGSITGNRIGSGVYLDSLQAPEDKVTTLTTIGGTISGNISGDSGGGIYAYESVITLGGHTLIKDNKAKYGGGIYSSKSDVTLRGYTRVEDNEAEYGGGMYTSNEATANIEAESFITKNKATTNGGGGVHVQGGQLKVNGGSITENTGEIQGGGVVIDNGRANSSHMTMKKGTIAGNKARYGGGVSVYGDRSTFTMEGGVIENNEAIYIPNEYYGGGGGGGVMAGAHDIGAITSTFTMEGGVIQKNKAGENGGGVYSKSYFTLNGGVITDNAITENNSLSANGVYEYYYAYNMTGPFTMNGGLVFGSSSDTSVPVLSLRDKLLQDPSPWTPDGNGVVVGWSGDAGSTYTYGDTDDLSILPDSTPPAAFWALNNNNSGIAYEKGTNKGFIPLDVQVNLIPITGDALLYELENVGTADYINVGDTLGIKLTGVPRDALEGLTYSWLANGQPIPEATQTTYKIRMDDIDKEITAKVHASGIYTGSLSAQTFHVGKIILKGTVRIVEEINVGTPDHINVGDTLGVDLTGLLTPGAAQHLTYQWSVDGVPADNAADTTFVVPGNAVDKAITVTVMATDDYTGSLVSAPVYVGDIIQHVENNNTSSSQTILMDTTSGSENPETGDVNDKLFCILSVALFFLGCAGIWIWRQKIHR